MREKENNKYEWPSDIAFPRSENEKLPAMSMIGDEGATEGDASHESRWHASNRTEADKSLDLIRRQTTESESVHRFGVDRFRERLPVPGRNRFVRCPGRYVMGVGPSQCVEYRTSTTSTATIWTRFTMTLTRCSASEHAGERHA